jgi:hypothetical protein
VHAPVRSVPPVNVATALGLEVPLRSAEEFDVDVDVVVLTRRKK